MDMETRVGLALLGVAIYFVYTLANWYCKTNEKKKKKKKKQKNGGVQHSKRDTEPVPHSQGDTEPVPHSQGDAVGESWRFQTPISFRIIDDTHATLRYTSGDVVTSTYVRVSGEEEALDCSNSSQRAHHQSILPPIWTAKDPHSEEWLVFYKPFSPFSSHDQLSDEQLFSSARNILKALHYIQGLSLALKHMVSQSNFVIHKGEIRLINIREVNVKTKWRAWRADIVTTSQIFDQFLPLTKPRERQKFISYLRNMETASPNDFKERLQKASKYPYLQDSKHRVRYFFDLHMRMSNHTAKGPYTLQQDRFKPYATWESKARVNLIENGHRIWMRNRKRADAKRTKPREAHKDYENNKVLGLLNFLRNLYTHAIKREADVQVLDDYATNMHPLFSCLLFETFEFS